MQAVADTSNAEYATVVKEKRTKPNITGTLMTGHAGFENSNASWTRKLTKSGRAPPVAFYHYFIYDNACIKYDSPALYIAAVVSCQKQSDNKFEFVTLTLDPWTLICKQKHSNYELIRVGIN